MAQVTRDSLVEAMKEMDICFMATKDGDKLCSRPMSNNAQVDWDGDNWFFTNGDTRKVRQLEVDSTVMLDFSGEKDWISLRGTAQLHRDAKPLFQEHWTKDIDQWFPDGVDTPGLVLIQVTADEAELFGALGEGIVKLG
ncbi:MAG TPA: pyridoxamine 5'-phosphate oxidase family protein [Brevundimonas sp.]|nr:pyridoxamine 5'-phosphate oxidase family protein [Brevundimonas sp.]